jgi:hypothetical protein
MCKQALINVQLLFALLLLLMNTQVGFSEFIDAGEPAGVTRGFRRPIHVYIK